MTRFSAVDADVTAISVSNHGGNNDGTPVSIMALPGIVDVVGDRVEIVMDGGLDGVATSSKRSPSEQAPG